MKKRTDYKECPYCWCNLDPGEICDCQRENIIAGIDLSNGVDFSATIVNGQILDVSMSRKDKSDEC